jgi:hypothetical protein
VVKCLFERGCLPQVMCGTSVGALVVALLGIHKDSQLPQLWREPVDFAAFDGIASCASSSARRKLVRLLKSGVLMDVTKMVKLCQDNLGDMTFAEAYRRTRRVINITLPHRSQNRGGAKSVIAFILVAIPLRQAWHSRVGVCRWEISNSSFLKLTPFNSCLPVPVSLSDSFLACNLERAPFPGHRFLSSASQLSA